MSDSEQVTQADTGVWKRMMRNYAVALIAGVVLLAYLMPRLSTDASTTSMVGVLIGGLLLFAGGFGVVVALFFHYLNRSK